MVRLEVIELVWGCHNIILCGQLRSGKSLIKANDIGVSYNASLTIFMNTKRTLWSMCVGRKLFGIRIEL